MARRDFDGMDKAELLIAIEEAKPGLSFPETASREDLIQYLAGIMLPPPDPDQDGDEGLGVGVRNRGPRTPAGAAYAEAETES
jgi:hypothetical protein